jgi:hypothetical protein
MQAKIKSEIEKAVLAHSLWKTHLKEAITTGKSHFSVTTVGNSHLCEFGKWLDSAEANTIPNYQEVVKLHQEFHKAAAQVLELALSGKSEAALSQMQLGSHFSQLTAQLVSKLAELK